MLFNQKFASARVNFFAIYLPKYIKSLLYFSIPFAYMTPLLPTQVRYFIVTKKQLGIICKKHGIPNTVQNCFVFLKDDLGLPQGVNYETLVHTT